MKKIYISQPMRDLTQEEITNRRNEIIIKLKNYFNEEIEIIDSYFKEDFQGDASPLMFLGKSIQAMANADYIIMGMGWENARGCRTEHFVAKEYGITILYESPYIEFDKF